MIDEKYIRTLLIVFCLVMLTLSGCGSKDEKQASSQAEVQKPGAQSEETVSANPPSPAGAPTAGSTVVIDVDGSKLTQGQVETEVKRIMSVDEKANAGRASRAGEGECEKAGAH